TQIGTMTTAIRDLNAAVQDNSTFSGPNGADVVGGWPQAVTEASKGTLDDGTVTDGDADWSAPRR
ncbi:MAG: hypothetical protein L0G99_14875, partial [Propionibacteriales bacterium]|nr:hypothetical protein [Propionibacteriales bacterium]